MKGTSFSLFLASGFLLLRNNYHKNSSLKQHTFTTSQFCRSEVQTDSRESSAWSRTRLKSRHGRDQDLIGGCPAKHLLLSPFGLLYEFSPLPLQGWGPHCLAGCHSQLLKAAGIPRYMAPPSSKPARAHGISSSFKSLPTFLLFK